MKVKKVLIFGGKGTAVNIAEQIEHARGVYGYPMSVLGFAIDDPALGDEIAGFPAVSGVKEAWQKYRESDVAFIFALYRPDVMEERLDLLRQLAIPPQRFANFIHPTAYVARSVVMGYGNVVLSQASLLHGVTVGNFNIINANVVVEHDTTVHDGCFIAGSVSIGSKVSVGTGTFVGLNSAVREGVHIGDYAYVGMSSCVLQNVEDRTVVFGVPASAKK